MKTQLKMSTGRKWRLLFAVLMSFGLMLSTSAHAATFIVDRSDDAAVSVCSAAPDDCTLRGAITAANTNAGTDAINFDATVFATPQIISTVNALPHLIAPVRITGPGAALLTVKESDDNHNFNMLFINYHVRVALSGLTLSNGSIGILNRGILIVTDCILSDNRSYGILNDTIGDGTMTSTTATNCTVSGSSWGIINKGILRTTNCTLSGNGDGIYNQSGTLTATNCTVSGNVIGIGNGGTAIITNCTINDNLTSIGNNRDGTLILTNCTLSGSTVSGLDNVGTLTATNCTVSGNIWGLRSLVGTVVFTHCTFSGNTTFGLYNDPAYSGTVTLRNTICVDNNINLNGSFIDGGYNITNGTAAQVGLEVDGSGNPVLADNGGPTKTIKLLPGSPALDKGNSFGTITDQRGQARPFDDLTLTNASGGDGSDIGAFEAQPTFTVNNARTFNEGSAASPGSATFTVALSGANTQAVTVTYQTANGINNSAIAGSDYVAKSGKLTFAPGETSKRVTVKFIGDSVSELNETFFLDLKTATNATLNDSRGVGTIRNDDGPSITIADAVPVDEGKSTATPQAFVVFLSAASTDTITVNWATANGTAGPNDYIAAAGTLTFAPGETSKLIIVQINGDTTVEPDETYEVNLSKSAYAVLADSQAIGTIRNDDAALLFENGEPSE